MVYSGTSDVFTLSSEMKRFLKKWERFRKRFKVLKMRNLSNFNDIYNIQDVLIIGMIPDYRWQKVEDKSGFDPRYFTSASTLGFAIERIKSKVIF